MKVSNIRERERERERESERERERKATNKHTHTHTHTHRERERKRATRTETGKGKTLSQVRKNTEVSVQRCQKHEDEESSLSLYETCPSPLVCRDEAVA